MCQGNRPEADRALRPECSKRGARTACFALRPSTPCPAVLAQTRRLFVSVMPRASTDPVPAEGRPQATCDTAEERATLPTGDAPQCHFAATHRAVCRRRQPISAIELRVLANPDGTLFVYLEISVRGIPSVRSDLHHVSVGEVRATQRVELTHLIPWLQETVEYRRAQLAGVTLEPFGKGLHFAIPWEDPVAQLVLRLRANLARNGFVFSYEPHPHITWL